MSACIAAYFDKTQATEHGPLDSLIIFATELKQKLRSEQKIISL